MVFADDLSVPAILAAIAGGRTVVKLQGPADPMVVLESDVPADGDTITADFVELRATVTGAPPGASVRFVHNGMATPPVAVEGEGFVVTVQATAPATGEDRWRAEAIVDGQPRTITSHLWLREDPNHEPTPDAPTTGGVDVTGTGTTGAASSPDATDTAAVDPQPPDIGCSCGAIHRSPPLWALLLLILRRRRDHTKGERYGVRRGVLVPSCA